MISILVVMRACALALVALFTLTPARAEDQPVDVHSRQQDPEAREIDVSALRVGQHRLARDQTS